MRVFGVLINQMVDREKFFGQVLVFKKAYYMFEALR